MKIIFFGLGSIGNRHARLIKSRFNHHLFAYRSSAAYRPNSLGMEELYSWAAVKKVSPDIAFITNPTYLHIETAIRCARAGMHLFIEKPIDCRNDRLGELIKIADEKKLTVYVAYCMRFNPIIRNLLRQTSQKEVAHARVVASSYIPAWRPGRDYRGIYSSYRSKGGGVIFEFSHEIDYIQYLFGDIVRIQGSHGKISDLEVSADDYADFIIKCKKSIVNLHLNFFSRNLERAIVIDFKNSDYIKADLISNTVLIYRHNRQRVMKYYFERDAVYLAQLKYFFRNIHNNRIMNNLSEASKLFKVILALNKLR